MRLRFIVILQYYIRDKIITLPNTDTLSDNQHIIYLKIHWMLHETMVHPNIAILH
jgi:hypothetical protein